MKPKFAITIGDPNGIGPEIVLKLFINNNFKNTLPLVIADPTVLEYYIKLYSFDLKIETFDQVENIKTKKDVIPCFPLTPIHYIPQPGLITAQAGLHAFEYIKKAIEFCNQKKLQGIVTAPINKEALKLAKVPYLDHTEMLTILTESKNTMTLFVTGNLKIFFYSRHISFREIVNVINIEKIVSTIQTCIKHLKLLGIKKPHLALAVLNPHASEHGMFGKEEIEILEPAVENAKKKIIYIYPGLFQLIPFFTLQKKVNMMQYLHYIMTRDILPPKHINFIKQFQSPPECLLLGLQLIMALRWI